jgi:hypothetical protein
MRLINYITRLITPFILCFTAANVNAQTYECRPSAPADYKKTLVIDASTMTIVSGPLQYKNDDKVWVVVENINPFVATYTLKATRHPVTESAISAFLPSIGGIAAEFLPKQTGSSQQAATPEAPKATPAARGRRAKGPPPPPPTCDVPIDPVISKYNALLTREGAINDAVTDATKTYAAYSVKYADMSSAVSAATQCPKIQTNGMALRDLLNSVRSPDQLEGSKFGAVPSDQDPVQILQAEIAMLLAKAKELRRAILDYRRAVIGKPICEQELKLNEGNLKTEDDFVDNLIDTSERTPEVQALKDQVNKLKAQYLQLAQTRVAVARVFDGSVSNPFALARGITDSQSDVELTLVPSPSVASEQQNAPPTTKTALGSAPKGAGSNSPPFDETIHFGYGARFSISGGMTVALLTKREFTTANGQVAYQDHSKTRILPIALLNSWIFDCDPKLSKCLWVPQLSFGITAKSDDKGTSPEYLVGPSWALAGRQLILTLGAYDGKQQRLLGGLHVGDPTTLSAANLPIAKEYHWSAAFAISWKLK